ncbi:MAG: hypothetical protein LUB56_02245 [Coprobacillus sp.]|nr:hypothetical protein [Coprobacillus sp.]
MVLEDLKDEDLASLFCSTRNEKYLMILIEHYKKRLSYLAFQYHQYHLYSGISYQDLYLVVLESFYLAISKYKPEEGTSLYGYWKSVAAAYISNYIKENSYEQKGRMFKGSFSLDGDVTTDDNELPIAEIFGEEDEFIANYGEDFLTKFALLKDGGVYFREIEDEIITDLIKGYTIKEICEKLNISEVRFKSIQRTIRHKCATNKNTH